jgi:hypothetical protein
MMSQTIGTVLRRLRVPEDRPVAPVATAAVAVVAAAYIAAVDPNHPGHYPTCPFLSLTGYYCPGCGSLRAIHALTHGDVVQALHRNPLTVVFAPYLIWAWGSWLYRTVTGRPRGDLAPPWVLWALLVVVTAFWVLRNLPGFSWLAP